MQSMRSRLLPSKVQLFDDPMAFIEPIKAMNWMHELFVLYKSSIGQSLINDSFEMVCTIMDLFSEYINTHKFVTMKQTEL